MKSMPLIPYKYLFPLTKRYDNDISKITPPLIPDIPNKCFIHSPAVDKVKIIVFWFCWQQDFEWSFIEAGLLIKQTGTKPIRRFTSTFFYMGYVSTACRDKETIRQYIRKQEEIDRKIDQLKLFE